MNRSAISLDRYLVQWCIYAHTPEISKGRHIDIHNFETLLNSVRKLELVVEIRSSVYFIHSSFVSMHVTVLMDDNCDKFVCCAQATRVAKTIVFEE